MAVASDEQGGVQPATAEATTATSWLPSEMRRNIPEQDHRWISRALFHSGKLRPDLVLWYEPPVPALIYHQPPMPDRFFTHRLMAWMPYHLWKVRVSCPACRKQLTGYGVHKWAWKVLDIDSYYLMVTETLRCTVCCRNYLSTSQAVRDQLDLPHQKMFRLILTRKYACDIRVIGLLRSQAMGKSPGRLMRQLRESHGEEWSNRLAHYLRECAVFVERPSLYPVVCQEPPQPMDIPSSQWLLLLYSRDILSRLDHIKASITSTFGTILNMASTKKMVKKLAGHDERMGLWVASISNEVGQILSSVVTVQEGSGLDKMVAGLMERYRQARVPPPLLLYVDWGCCKMDRYSKLQTQFAGWPNVRIRLDIWNFMKRIAAGVTTDAHALYPTFMSCLSACIFEWDAGDLALLRQAKREQLRQEGVPVLTDQMVDMKISKKELSQYCRRRTRGEEATISRIEHLLQEFGGEYGKDPMGVPLLDQVRMENIWRGQKYHVKCIQDVPGIQLYTKEGTTSTMGGVVLRKYHCARGSTSLESFHCHINRFIPGSSANALNFQLYLLEGLHRWNKGRETAALTSGPSLWLNHSGNVAESINTNSLKVFGRAFVPTFRPPAKYTGELLGVDYLLSQTGQPLKIDPDFKETEDLLEDLLEDLQEGEGEDESVQEEADNTVAGLSNDSLSPTSSRAAPSTVMAAPSTTRSAPSTIMAAPSTVMAAPSTVMAAPSTTRAAPSTTRAAPSTVMAAPSTVMAAPSTVMAAPSTVMAAPSTVMAAPSTTRSAPSTIMAAPSTVMAAPSTVMAAPSTTRAAPSTTRAAPSTVMAAPSTVMAAPSTVMAAPSTVMAAPSTTRAAPSTVMAAPSTTRAAPSTVMAAPSTTRRAPSTVMAAPSTVMAAPSTVMAAASTVMAAPSTTRRAPSTVMAAPSTTRAAPSTVMAAPSTTRRALSTVMAAPSTVMAAPSTVMAAASTVMAAPSTVMAAPSTVMAAPSTVMAAPSTVMAAPSTIMAAPSTTRAAPSTVMAAASTVMAAPSTVMAAPSTVMAAPSTTRAAPSTIMAAPSTTRRAPSTVMAAPSTTRAAPSLAVSSSTLPVATMSQPDFSSAEESPDEESGTVEDSGVPGKERVDRLANYLVELRNGSTLALSYQQVCTIVALWQNLLEFDRRRLVLVARHQTMVDTERSKSFKKRQDFTPGVVSGKHQTPTTTAPPAQWPECSRLIETIFVRLCAIHHSLKKKDQSIDSRWDLILEDYKKIRKRILASRAVMGQTRIQLVEVSHSTLVQWHNKRVKRQDSMEVMQGAEPLDLPSRLSDDSNSLLPDNVRLPSAPPMPAAAHKDHLASSKVSQATVKRKVSPAVVQPSVGNRQLYPAPRAGPQLVFLAPAASKMPVFIAPQCASLFFARAAPAARAVRKVNRHVLHNTCKKCRQFRTADTGHSQYKGVVYCPSTETVPKEQWLEEMKKKKNSKVK